ncbi:MAG: glycosyl transferase [Robiginitomaculum sp.]|nr:MAG: glycosyl transferase [Robiginitomaculum sp.]
MAKKPAKTDPPQVDVVIVNFNAGDMLARTVACLQAQTLDNFHAIIIDNASSDDSLEKLSLDDPRFEIIKLDENTGFARGNNIGIAKGIAPWITCLNPDAFAEPGWLEALLRQAKSDPNIVMAGSTQIMADDHSLLDGAGDLYAPFGFAWRGLYHRPIDRLPETGEVFGPCAAAALYRRDAFEAVNGFDEDFFCYHEDVDLAFRLRLAGGTAVQVREAIVYHVGSGITGAESPFAVYHGTRNRIWTFFKNMPLVPLILLTPAHLGLSVLFLIRALFKRRAGPTWRGMVDGLVGLPGLAPKRRVVQQTRKLSSLAILRAMTWSPIRFLSRDADVRPSADT